MTDPVKILVVDDSEDDRLFYQRTLKKTLSASYTIVEADNGEDALKYVQEEEPACVLLDYSLPGHNGVEILKQIRGFLPFMPVVMLTGQGNEKVAVTAMQEGAQNYISKSTITPETLDHVIKVAIDHCALERRIDEQRTSLEVFTRALAHDLKEPMRTIRSFTELILNDGNPQEKKKYFQHIQNAADRMYMLIESVFFYTQLDSPGQATKENCPVATIWEEVKENLSQLLQERKAVITHGSLPNVYANRTQLAQILQNIVSNAVYHSSNPVTVHITAEAQGDYQLFSISDNGPGISKDNVKKVFDPFKRLVHHEEGAGLGLATCKKIIELHRGTIWCESELGKGTTFLFTLPKEDAMQKAAGPSAHRAPVTNPSKEKLPLANVLLVDDRDADLDLTRICLIEKPKLQCGLFMARDVETAIDMIHDANNSIDLMLLDINMPDMNGFELLEHMKAHGDLKNIAVIMCTGSTYEKDKEKAESLGATGYLVKPGKFDSLKAMIGRAANVQLRQEEEGYVLLRRQP